MPAWYGYHIAVRIGDVPTPTSEQHRLSFHSQRYLEDFYMHTANSRTSGITPHFGQTILARAEALAVWSDTPGALTCTYLTPAHRRTAAQIGTWMAEAGMQVHTDALGNVVGRFQSTNPHAKTLITGSHYDTVRNGGISHNPRETMSAEDADLAACIFLDFLRHFDIAPVATMSLPLATPMSATL